MIRRLLTLVVAGGALAAIAVVAYKVLADRQLDHPITEGRTA